VAKFVYHGAPAFIVALQVEVKDGDEVDGPAELEYASGFEKMKGKADEKKSSSKDKGDD
jgi:hypothetical protein